MGQWLRIVKPYLLGKLNKFLYRVLTLTLLVEWFSCLFQSVKSPLNFVTKSFLVRDLPDRTKLKTNIFVLQSSAMYAVARKDTRFSSMFAFFTVYDLPVWALLFFTLILFLFVGSFVYWLSPMNFGRRKNFGNVCFFIVFLLNNFLMLL